MSALTAAIAESCDWSTNARTCIGCIQNDFKDALSPFILILQLGPRSDSVCKNCADKLIELYESSQLANNIYGLANADMRQAESIACQELKTALTPIIALLETVDDDEIRAVVASLKSLTIY